MPRGRAAAALVLAALAVAACASRPREARGGAAAACRCAPGEACWPAPEAWQALASRLRGRLVRPASPLAPCREGDARGEACAAALARASDPFQLEDDPGATQSAGWAGAWTSAESAYAVVARDAADVAEAVRFAREHRLRLAVKGTGHDYLGRSSAAGSLLVWTHELRAVSVEDAFVPRGCPPGDAPSPAVTLGAGVRWLEAYRAVTVERGRYVQGGGCTSVGAAGGFLQGGGFGSWSRRYGTAAASLLEAEVVTADGAVLTANRCQQQDLFWALRGGGGGTFGVVTRVTLATHALPERFGVVAGVIAAKGDAAFRNLLERFVAFYGESLADERWGEQVRVKGDDTLAVSMVFSGMTADEARRVWRPLTSFAEARPDAFTVKLQFVDAPAGRMWDGAWLREHAPGATRGGAAQGDPDAPWWWTDDADQVSIFWYAYQSRWLPLELFRAPRADRLAAALFEGSRHFAVALHFNKGQAGAAPDAVARGRETSVNPAVYRAAALALAATGERRFPGVPGHEPDPARAEAARARVAAAMEPLRAVAPDAGTYVNEADYFEPDWQRAFWGEHYARLAEVKRRYDPEGLFHCHHCVGSEAWTADGRCRASP